MFENIIRQGYRVYGIALLAWAAWSALWIGTGLNMDPVVVGYGWLAVAVFGAILAISMTAMWYASDYTLFRTEQHAQRVRRFNAHVLSSSPLHVYILAMAAWSFLTIEWWFINLGLVGRTIVGSGWLLIALYGLALTVGLTAKHKDDIMETAEEITPGEVGSQTRQ